MTPSSQPHTKCNRKLHCYVHPAPLDPQAQHNYFITLDFQHRMDDHIGYSPLHVPAADTGYSSLYNPETDTGYSSVLSQRLTSPTKVSIKSVHTIVLWSQHLFVYNPQPPPPTWQGSPTTATPLITTIGSLLSCAHAEYYIMQISKWCL